MKGMGKTIKSHGIRTEKTRVRRIRELQEKRRREQLSMARYKGHQLERLLESLEQI